MFWYLFYLKARVMLCVYAGAFWGGVGIFYYFLFPPHFF